MTKTLVCNPLPALTCSASEKWALALTACSTVYAVHNTCLERMIGARLEPDCVTARSMEMSSNTSFMTRVADGP
eukprot:365645-Chlamydomonas_euryale.AAC.7